MNFKGAMKIFTILFSMIVFLASISCAPSYNPEYDTNLRELLDLLQMQKDASLEERLAGMHQVTRKSGRSPQLRLRFGKRPDATFPPENNNVQLRLRYGKRSDSQNTDNSIEVPAYLGGLNELDN